MDWLQILRIILEISGSVIKTIIRFMGVAFIGVLHVFKKGRL